METSTASSNLAATALALLILTELLPAAGPAPGYCPAYPESENPEAAASWRHRRHRP
ncbi:hypothetical protein [Hymenobacter rubripertinctus]|uniref:hypothetical protein n=1 Tax=Hymenobacter rubripertinctus TaxID=2029981 RepID=UPI001602FA3A|nr:hypothetical protein [Hymenobacter rubripertinctus]